MSPAYAVLWSVAALLMYLEVLELLPALIGIMLGSACIEAYTHRHPRTSKRTAEKLRKLTRKAGER